jgi:UDP-N-acetylglucosamine 2-epimerase (non-hydrolysing)
MAIGARFALVPPLDYPEMIRLLKRAWLVLTDSGGIQEEACALGAPVLVLRTSTERPELLETGAGRLVGCDPFRIVEEVDWLWKHPEAYEAMRAAENPFGDGKSSARIASILGQWLADRGAEPGTDAPDARTRHGVSTEVQAPTSIQARRWSA